MKKEIIIFFLISCLISQKIQYLKIFVGANNANNKLLSYLFYEIDSSPTKTLKRESLDKYFEEFKSEIKNLFRDHLQEENPMITQNPSFQQFQNFMKSFQNNQNLILNPKNEQITFRSTNSKENISNPFQNENQKNLQMQNFSSIPLQNTLTQTQKNNSFQNSLNFDSKNPNQKSETETQSQLSNKISSKNTLTTNFDSSYKNSPEKFSNFPKINPITINSNLKIPQNISENSKINSKKTGTHSDLKISKKLFALLNSNREKKNLSILKWDKNIYQKAEIHTLQMEKENSLSHKNFENRISGNYKTAFENVGMIGGEILGENEIVEKLMGNWEKSKGHSKNMNSEKIDSGAICVVVNYDEEHYYSTMILVGE